MSHFIVLTCNIFNSKALLCVQFKDYIGKQFKPIGYVRSKLVLVNF